MCEEKHIKEYFEEQMFKNYCSDENRFTNQPSSISTFVPSQSSNESYHKQRMEKLEQKRKAKKESYIDYDEPTANKQEAAETNRQIIIYDDL
jgi:hypothetical protein